MSRVLRRHVGTRAYECRPLRKGGPWYIHWTEDRRSKRISTGQKTAAEASVAFDRFIRDLTEQKASALTCADLWEAKYGDGQNPRADHAWKSLGPYFGALRPIEITPRVERKYARERGVAASTLRVELSFLRASWNLALKRRMVGPHDLPALDPLPEGSPARDRWLSDDEIARLFAVAKHRRRVWLFLKLALETAARRASIEDLEWDQVDWTAGVIHYLKPGARQSRKRRASVPISRALLPVLTEAFETRNPGDPFVIGRGGRINDALAVVAKHAKVAGVTPHVLRHTAATIMARNGVSLWIVAKVLGNTVEQVEKVYAKYQPGMARAAVDGISGEWRAA